MLFATELAEYKNATLRIVYHWVRGELHVLQDSAKRLDSNSLTIKGDKFIGIKAVTN